ncbi:MAG: shikimate kinase AroL [Desulfovibrio sp.]|uniref:shikimate kinase AroL n=1 Tax=Desulfovibrio sp. 7SRBS1 TaxID=3378064 RepID=UPI003B40D699
MRAMRPKATVQIRHNVEDADKTAVYSRGKKASDAPGTSGAQGNVYLVGLRASGKTTLGKMLAERLGRSFVDTDELCVQQAGMTIAELVQAQGWDGFRELEAKVVRQVGETSGQVVATGGGVVLRDENRDVLRDTGRVFYLMADPGLLAGRLAKDPNEAQRPALTDMDLRQELAATLTEREPLYMGVANFILQAGAPLESLVEDVLEKLKM